MGLMVTRDLDITVICESLDGNTLQGFAEIGAKLMLLDQYVASVRFKNDTGPWNADPAAYPDGLYLWLSVRTHEGNDWTVDIWAVDEPEKQPDLAHLRTLMPRITDVDREIILQIKQELADRGCAAGERVPSALVYEAVMDGGIRETATFDAWLSNRRVP